MPGASPRVKYILELLEFMNLPADGIDGRYPTG
jgi:hypothetical protein